MNLTSKLGDFRRAINGEKDQTGYFRLQQTGDVSDETEMARGKGSNAVRFERMRASPTCSSWTASEWLASLLESATSWLVHTGSAVLPALASCALLFCWHRGRFSKRTDVTRLHSDTAPQRAVTFPINTDVHESNDAEKFSKFTQFGKGIDIIPSFDATVDVSKLPRIAWVIVVTGSSIAKYAQELTHLSCYASKAGIPLYVEHVVMVDDRHFMTARHRSVAKHLRYHQWVLATDADVIVGNSSRDIKEYLDDSVDVIVNDRDNREVCACSYLVRNSPGGWSFLKRWMAWDDDGDHQNYDNGDLCEMVAAGLQPGMPNNADDTGRMTGAQIELAQSAGDSTGCVNAWYNWDGYNAHFLDCVDRSLSHFRYTDHSKPYWEAVLWKWSHSLPSVRIRVYKSLAGFMRWVEAPSMGPKGPWESVSMPHDFLLTGKALHQFLEAESLLCTGQDWVYPAQRWSLDESRRQMTIKGALWWPGCFDSNGFNACQAMAKDVGT